MVARKPRMPLFFTQGCRRVCQGQQSGFVSGVGAPLPWLTALLPWESLDAPWPRSGALFLQIWTLSTWTSSKGT